MEYIIEGVESDLLEQFKRGKNTLAICSAIDRQIEALVRAFGDIKSKTNFDKAEGNGLDLIGTIVDLSRAEAGLLSGETEIPYAVLSDDKYRKFLKYQAYRNANGCSYYDLVNAMRVIWGDATKIHYSEEASYPATILIELEPEHTDEPTDIRYVPLFRPAGVGILYRSTISTVITVSSLLTIHVAQDYPLCGNVLCGTLYEQATLYAETDGDINTNETVTICKTAYMASGTAKCGIYY